MLYPCNSVCREHKADMPRDSSFPTSNRPHHPTENKPSVSFVVSV